MWVSSFTECIKMRRRSKVMTSKCHFEVFKKSEKSSASPPDFESGVRTPTNFSDFQRGFSRCRGGIPQLQRPPRTCFTLSRKCHTNVPTTKFSSQRQKEKPEFSPRVNHVWNVPVESSFWLRFNRYHFQSLYDPLSFFWGKLTVLKVLPGF